MGGGVTPPGRPEIGTPINIRLGDGLLARVDAYAARVAISRSQALRALVSAALAECDDETLASY